MDDHRTVIKEQVPPQSPIRTCRFRLELHPQLLYMQDGVITEYAFPAFPLGQNPDFPNSVQVQVPYQLFDNGQTVRFPEPIQIIGNYSGSDYSVVRARQGLYYLTNKELEKPQTMPYYCHTDEDCLTAQERSQFYLRKSLESQLIPTFSASMFQTHGELINKLENLPTGYKGIDMVLETIGELARTIPPQGIGQLQGLSQIKVNLLLSRLFALSKI